MDIGSDVRQNRRIEKRKQITTSRGLSECVLCNTQTRISQIQSDKTATIRSFISSKMKACSANKTPILAMLFSAAVFREMAKQGG
ncbi:hypothetical protein [Acidithiobacillus thiooxidans]|uniref:hypothetical protein n=1 Tax=Acidithiobacillus thiooxidans TaxID=930 RepID=UPI00192AD905|nr:hypothetical protein [Acidithiobacillus thiooxidans]